jgi:predicted acyl esterase
MALSATISHPLLREISSPEAPDSFYAGFNPSIQTLLKGHKRHPRSRPFPVATIYERDVQIPMRDGSILRADIFRPEDTGSVPAILPWSPYGKSGTGKRYLCPE